MKALRAVLSLGFVFALLPLRAMTLPALTDTTIEKLRAEKIAVGSQIITAEIADTAEARERGLMYRKSLAENEGMLFVFEEAQPMAFWMKNTLIPLSIGYFGDDKKLIDVYEMTPAVMGEAHPRTYPSSRPTRYALEMNKGWFDRHHVKPGTELRFLAASAPKKKTKPLKKRH